MSNHGKTQNSRERPRSESTKGDGPLPGGNLGRLYPEGAAAHSCESISSLAKLGERPTC
jgi:hypothetical protein